ncbi:hypothetical protein Tco_0630122, partial [Tanacetum coccineum]
LALADSETESDEVVTPVNKEKDASNRELTEINTGVQDEGQAGSNPGKQDEGQAGSNPGKQDEGQARSNPGNAAEFQPQPSHVVHAGPNLKPMDLAENLKLPTEDQVILEEPASSTGTLSSLQNLEKELSFTDQFFMEKPQEEEPEKTNAESEVQSMVTVPIHQDTSSVPPMTTPVIDLTTSQSDSLTFHASLPTSTATTTTVTTTTLPPPPLQPQQSTTDPILLQRIGELEQHMANLIQDKSALEERLDKHGSRLYNLENLNIPQKVSKVVDEIVTDAVDWALQAPLHARFRDLPEADMKEILLQRMWETGSYKTHEDHKNLYEALEKSESPRTPSGSPPPPPPPPPPSLGASGALGAPGALSGFTATQETSPTDYLLNDDSIPDEQVHLSDDEETGNDHLPKADLRKYWWKPLPEEVRPVTPKLSWTIPSSNVSDVENNWASVLVSTYEPPAENSLLAKTGDMMTFMNWYCQKVNKIMLTQADFEGQAYELVKAFYPNVIHLQFQMEECHKMLTNQINWANPKGGQVRIDVIQPLPLGGPPGHVTIQRQFFFNKDLEYLRYDNKGSRLALLISKTKAASYPDFGLELLVPKQIWIDEVCTYDISAAYGISHWWFNQQKFYIERHDSPSHRREVRKHMRILSVVKIKAYSRYGYDYLSEIVIRRADFQEHKIAEKDFKNVYPSDFEDLNLLLLQGHLDHLPGSNKRMLSTTVKLWTRNLVIRQRVIESYQTQLNLTKPGWDAKGFEFKHDYTIIESPRAVVFPVNNNERKIMRFNEIYKFSDGTLTRILEALDYRVKEFKIKRLNPVKMEMEIPRSSGVNFITACSYSSNTSNNLMKAQVYASKLPQL